MELTDLEKIALSRLFDPRQNEAKKLSQDLADGTKAEVDIVVRVRGTVTKGHSSTKIVAANVPVWDLLTLALDKVNEATLESMIRKTIESGIDKDEVKSVKDRVNEAIDRLKLTTKKSTAGSIRAELELLEVEIPEVEIPEPPKFLPVIIEESGQVALFAK